MERNNSLDLIKGFSCVLMILAHSYPLYSYNNYIFKGVFFIGATAPVLFFASTGMSLFYQLKRRSLVTLILFYLIFFYLSFINLGVSGPNYFYFSPYNIFTTIALCGIITAVFLRYNLNYPMVFAIPFIIHLALVQFNLGPSFNPILRPLLIYPGLGILPWLSFFLLGSQFLKADIKVNRKWTIAFIAGFIISVLFRIPFVDYALTYKHTMSVSYYLFSLSLLGVIYCFMQGFRSKMLTFLGKNSLLFWYAHIFIINHLPVKSSPLVIWAVVFVSTLGLIKMLNTLNQYIAGYTNNWYFWSIIISAPIVGLYLPDQFVSPFFYFFGILMSLNYHVLFKLTKRLAKTCFEKQKASPEGEAQLYNL